VDAAFSAAILAPPDPDHPALAQSEALIRELEACDVLVIGTPMHNFCVPAVLKAWIDQIVRIHRTFASTPSGKVGKLPDRMVYVVVASGGWFTGPSPVGTPPQPDFLTPYLRTIFATIGLQTVHFITLEGVTRGPDAAAHALATAQTTLDQLLPAVNMR
jgi:FMN-dependent NADH-azoreductase